MPEGHTVHRLARVFTELFAGQSVSVSSPQGRFAAGASVLDGWVLTSTRAVGKQLFVTFSPADALPGPEAPSAARVAAGPGVSADAGDDAPPVVRVLRVHLGLYGAWTFAGDGSAPVAHAIGAPRRRVGEQESVLAPLPRGTEVPIDPVPEDGIVSGADAATAAETAGEGWAPPAPRGAVRVRVRGAHAVADLTGPTACEVLTPAEADAIVARLGPDPIAERPTVVPYQALPSASRSEAPDPNDPARFVDAVHRSRSAISTLLMDQSVVAGVGNIYRAEVLYRARLDPFRAGRSVPLDDVSAVWDDLVILMRDGVRTGAIVTTRPEDRFPGGTTGRHRVRQNADATPGAVPSDQAFYVYHREGLPCRVCGNPVLVREVAGRNLFWCGTCQG